MSDITDGLFDGYPDVDQRSCRLLGPTALITQGLMGILVISSLVFKRHRETPKRPWRTWLFDVSKQVIGQLVVHGVNVLISHVVAHVSSGNACVFYFLNILIDTTIGVGIIYFTLQLLTWLLSEKCNLKGFESGQYGSPPSINYWARQAAVYVFSLLVMKLLVVALFAAWPGVFKLGEWLLSFLGPSDALQVIFTMGLFPIMMNVVQFWLIDSIVKSSQEAAVALPSARSSLDPDHEPLFHVPSDEEDDDDSGSLHARHDVENPPPRSISHSRVHTPVDENKSFTSGSATAAASGATTPAPKAIDIATGRRTPPAHAYPPSLVSTGTDGSTSASSASSLSARTRSISPRPKPEAVNVPSAALQQKLVGESRPEEAVVMEENDWAPWDEDGGDDWVERVGEDEWTRKRLETQREHVDEAWTRQDNATHNVS